MDQVTGIKKDQMQLSRRQVCRAASLRPVRVHPRHKHTRNHAIATLFCVLSSVQVEVRLDLAAGRVSVVQLSESLRPAAVNGTVIGAAGNTLILRAGGKIQ